MASATARLTFLFDIPRKSPLKQKFSLHSNPLRFYKTLNFPSSSLNLKYSVKSIDISKEDKPTSDNSDSQQISSDTEVEKEEQFDRRRLEERFAVLNTGIHECTSCGYQYNEAVGDPTYPIAPGLEYSKLPEDWRCPTCGASKSFFVSKSVEIAGFAQNQQFGLGGNTLTSGQKALLIYGSLLLFFVLFLSGYFLQ